jgi:hypothetical protein
MSLIINVVFDDIVTFKFAQNASSSSESWFRKWWKINELHKINIKSLTMKRYEAVTNSDVMKWFDKYKNILRELKIERRNLINFDETEFRIDCSKEQKIIVSDDVQEFYEVNSENRKSVTIIEMINAVDDYFTSLMIIIQNQEIMTSWFSNDLSANTHVVTSDSDFTFDQIAVKFLKHYIKHSDAESNAEWKLMLMNNHDSHLTSEFISLTNDHHIRSFSLISHLTHCMQSLDVRIFQSYKKWHDTTIKEVVAKSFVEYSLTRFLSDLTKIRNNIFKSIIIRHAFEKCDMWSVNSDACIKLLKKFNYSVKVKELTLSLLRQEN